MNQPREIALNYIGVAKAKTSLVWYKTLILAVMAGVFIALAGALATIAGSGFTGMQASLIKGAVFPLGLILVVICGSELFTGNCLLVAPTLNKDIKATAMLKNWGIVYIGNFIGAIIIAVLVVYGQAYSDSVVISAVDLVAKKSVNFGYALLKGILCNMLVCLAVWAAMASKNVTGKILAVYLPVFAFVVCGFEHSIANMYYIMAAFMTSASGGLNFGYAILNGLLAPTIGNIIGGGLIAVAYFATYFKQNKPKDSVEQ
ncbi:MAG: formate/nitrite transporter family protein [Clostridiales bacterium]|nr:formate/nitrite transporter family protein [Clostridiales bacterium]